MPSLEPTCHASNDRFFHLVQTGLAQHMDQELVVERGWKKTAFLLEFLRRCLWLLKKPCANPRFNKHLGTFCFFWDMDFQKFKSLIFQLSNYHSYIYIYIYLYISFKVCFQSHNILDMIWWSFDQRHTNNYYDPPCNELKEIWIPINLDMIYHHFSCSILFVLKPFAFV